MTTLEVASARTQSCDSESDNIPNIPQCTLPPCLISDPPLIFQESGSETTAWYPCCTTPPPLPPPPPPPPPHLPSIPVHKVVPQPLPSEGPGDDSQSISHFLLKRGRNCSYLCSTIIWCSPILHHFVTRHTRSLLEKQ